MSLFRIRQNTKSMFALLRDANMAPGTCPWAPLPVPNTGPDASHIAPTTGRGAGSSMSLA
jgi:hypothetical protein